MHTYFDEAIEKSDRASLRDLQSRKLITLFREAYKHSQFYNTKWKSAGVTDSSQVKCLEDFLRLPFTAKSELVKDQEENPPFGTNLCIPVRDCIRMHQTSGTTGKPLRMLDTSETWDWWLRCWSFVYKGAGVGPGDRVYMAFSFGPFIGFWSAYEAAEKIGALAIPGGGLQTKPRLQAIIENETTVLVCTPTYALRLAEVAAEHNMDITNSSVKRIICAGEPGANIPSTKKRIEDCWGAKCFDHTGMTEAGAIGFECESQPAGIHLIESEFIIEVIDPITEKPLSESNKGELVITNLGRYSMPVFRYRTGDLVRLNFSPCDCGRTFVRADGGILGRADDMFVVRGINIFPSAIENIVRNYQDVEEFRIEIYKEREMKEINIQLELNPSVQSPDLALHTAQSLVDELQTRLLLTAKVTLMPCGGLPRFDMKAKRCVICD
ncbi:phenylacetate--CoA ligase family protein [Chloroflexota bacterium]